jgi:hypothetical protein
MLTIVLGINTLVSSYDSKQSTREASVRAMIAAEEEYWNAASKELGEISQLKSSQDSNGWGLRHKLLRDRVINHPKLNPEQEEFNDQQREAMRGIEALRVSVETALADAAIYGEQAEKAETAIATREENLAIVARQDHLTAEQRGVAQVAAGAIATRARSISLTPQSADGWDIDVFWCERGDESGSQANFDAALQAGRALAGIARKSDQRVGGEKIGRVRVRALGIAQQRSSGVDYPKSGLWLRFDDTDNERPLAQALTKLPALSGYQLEATQGYTSKWYISAYACALGNPA